MIDEDSFIGRQIGNYKVIEKIGVGTCGCVYRGEHIYLDSPVAIKLLHPFSQMDHELFLQEAQLHATLKYQYIPSFFDFGIHENFPYLVIRS